MAEQELNQDLHLVIIAGGSGTRFWPKSTSARPKQLLSFGNTSQKSLLAQTLSRFDGLVPADQRLIVTTEKLKAAIAEEKFHVEILAEPQGRNTAPCVYWAARVIADKNPRGVMMIMPSDHSIFLPDSFRETLKMAADWARTHSDLVTLGIKPSRPETGYGYLKTKKSSDTSHLIEKTPRKVEAFVEKPNLPTAEKFLSSGDYLWNGGMFLWRADTILSAFDQFMPEMKLAWEQSHGNIEEAYPKMTATSIDYGIMEKAQNVVTFPLDCGWDDVGSWTSLENLADSLGARAEGNTLVGGTLISLLSQGNIIDASKRVVALLDVNDMIIVEQGDVLMIAPKRRAQEIKNLAMEVARTRPDLV
jgi:mannose-1-phosphate guanylyltransferase